MLSEIYWIDSNASLRLAIMARPRAGEWLEDEVAHWRRSGIDMVVSLLEPDEIEDLGLQGEAECCEARGIGFLSFPIPDRGLPDDREAAWRFAAEIASAGRSVAIHCRAGIGRSSIMAAAVMVARGTAPAEALAAIRQARGLPVPDTDAQRDWVLALGSY